MEPAQLLINEWLMILFFVLGLIFWGYAFRKQSSVSIESSFLADRKVPGFIASLSTVATNMNANDFFGMTGAVYGVGLVMIHSPLTNSVVLIVIALLLMRRVRAYNVYSLGQWLAIRYHPVIGHLYSLIWAFVWMLFNLGLYIYAGALILHTLVGWNLYISIVLFTLIAATYTLLGGFRAVVATDVIQLVLMFFPFLFLAALVWQDTGGPIQLIQSLPLEKVNLWHAQTPFGPLVIALLGMLFMSMSYFSTEAQMVQRPLAARNPEAAAISYIGAGFWFTVLVPFVVFMPALAAIKLFPGLPNNDFAVPMLIKSFIPPGLYGITIVGLLAGTFSSCDSQINAFCAIFTADIYKKLIRKHAPESHYVRVSRLAGVVFTFAAIGTAVLFTFAKSGMFLFAIGIVATIMPPFGAVALLGVLWARTSYPGALAGLLAGFITAITLFVADLFGTFRDYASDSLYFRTVVTFVLTILVTAGGSLFVPAKAKSEPASVSPGNPHDFTRLFRLSALLLTAVVILYLSLTWMVWQAK